MKSSERASQSLKDLISDLAVQADGPLPLSITTIGLLIQLALSGCTGTKSERETLTHEASKVRYALVECGLAPEGEFYGDGDEITSWTLRQGYKGPSVPDLNYLDDCGPTSYAVNVAGWGTCDFMTNFDNPLKPSRTTFVLDCSQPIARH